MKTAAPFHDLLAAETSADQQFLLTAPVISAAISGRIDRARYIAFLTQAYHHVRHTVPLLTALGERLPDRHAMLRAEIRHYIDDEIGHDQWILNDIAAAGGDPRTAAASTPDVATDAMVAYAWDVVQRRNPIGFFGMVYVLEGTSVRLACQAADALQSSLRLPASGFTYLRSHGTLDQTHVQHLAGILNGLSDPADRAAVIQCARAIFWLYGGMFRRLGEAVQPAALLRETA